MSRWYPEYLVSKLVLKNANSLVTFSAGQDSTFQFNITMWIETTEFFVQTNCANIYNQEISNS